MKFCLRATTQLLSHSATQPRSCSAPRLLTLCTLSTNQPLSRSAAQPTHYQNRQLLSRSAPQPLSPSVLSLLSFSGPQPLSPSPLLLGSGARLRQPGHQAFRTSRPSAPQIIRQIAMSRARYEGPAGQNLAEPFAVCHPPPEGHDGFVDSVELQGHCKERQEVHKQGLWHRSVHVWVIHPPSRRVILQKRSEHKDTHPGLWDVSSAGHVTGEDDVAETAVREVEEELGITKIAGGDLKFLFTAVSQSTGSTAKHGPYRDNEFVNVFAVGIDEEERLVDLEVGDSEVSEVKLISLAELDEAIKEGAPWLVPRNERYRAKLFAELDRLFPTTS